jgi:hypothetical protein
MNHNILAYGIYLPVTAAITVIVARSLHRNTRAFLDHRFREKHDLSVATNNLIQTAFYLLSFGTAFILMKIAGSVRYIDGHASFHQLENGQETIEHLATKFGTYIFFVGMMLLLNFFIMLSLQNKRPGEDPHVIQNV